jgi:hypothetical protein
VNDSDIDTTEQVIRDFAGTCLSSIALRRSHPTYGATKTRIAFERERMEGAIGLYMVLTGQAGHAGVPSLAEYKHPETLERVATARREAGKV